MLDLREVVRGSPLAPLVFRALLYAVSRGLSPLRVTSSTGGQHAPDSQHPLGTAIDLGVRGSEGRAAREMLRRWRLIGLYGKDEGDHVHLQLFEAGRDTLV